MRITDGTITSYDKEDKEIYVAKYKLDTSESPYKITMTVAGGPRGSKGDKATGIIELKGKTLRLAYAYDGGETPTTFKSTGEKQLMFTMTTKKRDD